MEEIAAKRGKSGKRARVNFTAEQLMVLEDVFSSSQYPDVAVLEGLSDKMELPVEKILTWFQNRRSRYRKDSKNGHIAWMRKHMFNSEQKDENLTRNIADNRQMSNKDIVHVLSPEEALGQSLPQTAVTAAYNPSFYSSLNLPHPSCGGNVMYGQSYAPYESQYSYALCSAPYSTPVNAPFSSMLPPLRNSSNMTSSAPDIFAQAAQCLYETETLSTELNNAVDNLLTASADKPTDPAPTTSDDTLVSSTWDWPNQVATMMTTPQQQQQSYPIGDAAMYPPHQTDFAYTCGPTL